MSRDTSRNSHSPGGSGSSAWANNGGRSPSYSPSWRGGDRRGNSSRRGAYGTPTEAEIDALGDRMRAINVSGSPSNAGLRKSTKDWGRDHAEKRRSKVQDMPLVSRGGWSQEDEGLHHPESQRELYQYIQDRIKSLEKTYSSSSPLDLNPPTDSAEHRQYDLRKNDLENVVGLYRKLREGIIASKLSGGDVDFSRKAFEDSVDACLIARTFGELLKSLVGLAETVYPALKEPSPTTSLYTSYYILYESCYASSHRVALTLLPLSLGSSPHLVFARHVLHSLLRADYVAFFVLYRTAPTQGHRVLMDACIARVREQAIRTLARAYLRVEIGWVRETLGFVEGEEVVVERVRTVLGEGVERVEDGVVWFRKGSGRAKGA